MKISTKLALLPALTMTAAAMVGMSQTATAAWSPKKPVEFVIMAGPGGGADKMARLLQTAIQKNKFASKPFIPVNKPGGSGAEALMHLKAKSGDNHVIMVTLNTFYTTPIRQPGLNVDPLTFTPIARMAEDTFLLWVHKDKGVNNLDEFVKAAKAKGSKWIMAGTGRGGEDELLTSWMNTTFGLQMKYIPFKGGGRVAKELAGKQADSTVNNPSEQMGFFLAGDTKPLASFTGARLPLFPDAPTFTELGYPFEYYMQRSVVGTPGMSDDAAAYYRDVFAKVYESTEWKDYMKKKSLLSDFMTGDDLVQYWVKELANHKELLAKIGG
jgi:tripartite-type tricarboxylate transporter receptor subunit TctC